MRVLISPVDISVIWCYTSIVIDSLATISQNLPIDPSSGFVQFEDSAPVHMVCGVSSSLSFTPSKKLIFIDTLREVWPNTYLALKSVSVSYRSYEFHLNLDPAFKQAVADVNAEKVSALKAKMHEFAMTNPKCFMDRIALGRIYARDEFDPGARVEVTHKGFDRDDARKRLDRLSTVVDAEVVRAVTMVPMTVPRAIGAGETGHETVAEGEKP